MNETNYYSWSAFLWELKLEFDIKFSVFSVYSRISLNIQDDTNDYLADKKWDKPTEEEAINSQRWRIKLLDTRIHI